MDDPRPPTWDWVTARAQCSAYLEFTILQDQAARDIAARNAVRAAGEAVEFRLHAQADGFTVWAEGHDRRVVFARTGDAITIRGDGIAIALDVTLTLTATGACRFKVQGAELVAWQVLRLALEDLFFTAPPPKAPPRRTR
jgi:hypothetical protein